LQFNDIMNSVFASGPTVALIVASVLDNTLDIRGTEADRGLSWFTPFLHDGGYSDPRNEEFYSFPIRVLQKFTPSRFL
jgi:hypothetical protein